ncbi:MAG: NUDIX domain-containing protein [Bauldia sp.]
MSAPIAIVAAVVRDADGRVLLVRKHGTAAFLQPGGKREAGEGDIAALARELGEELGCGIVAGSARPVGAFSAPAANEAGREVVAHVYAVRLDGTPVASAEIAELAWVDPAAPGDLVLAPLTRDGILPALAGEGAMAR